MGWKLKRTCQCGKCPWRRSVDPRTIPNYDAAKHRELACTIAGPIPDIHGGQVMVLGDLNVMTCHETDRAMCVGWLANQLGPGNNLGLRIRMIGCENAHRIRTVGEQHETFEGTLREADRDGHHDR